MQGETEKGEDEEEEKRVIYYLGHAKVLVSVYEGLALNVSWDLLQVA